MAIFQLFCDNYVQNESNVLNSYFKENMYHLLRGLSHSIPEVKESCVSALMVLDLDEIQQYKLKKYLINEEVNHQNRITGESHYDTKLVNVLERFANISDHEFHGSTFKQDDCIEEVERIKQWLKKKGVVALNSLGDPSDTCLLYTSPSPRDKRQSRMPSSA